MITVLIIYFGIGVALQIKGLLARELNTLITVSKLSQSVGTFIDESSEESKSWIYPVLKYRLLYLFIYPIYYLHLVIRRRKEHKRKANLKVEDNYLYFDRITGNGNIRCKSCNKTFMDIPICVGDSNNYIVSAQCQDCGTIKSFERFDGDGFTSYGACECGGAFDINKPIFCPSCKSNEMEYSMNYMT